MKVITIINHTHTHTHTRLVHVPPLSPSCVPYCVGMFKGKAVDKSPLVGQSYLSVIIIWLNSKQLSRPLTLAVNPCRRQVLAAVRAAAKIKSRGFKQAEESNANTSMVSHNQDGLWLDVTDHIFLYVLTGQLLLSVGFCNSIVLYSDQQLDLGKSI